MHNSSVKYMVETFHFKCSLLSHVRLISPPMGPWLASWSGTPSPVGPWLASWSGTPSPLEGWWAPFVQHYKENLGTTTLSTRFTATTVPPLQTLVRSEKEALKRRDAPLRHHRTSPPPSLPALRVAAYCRASPTEAGTRIEVQVMSFTVYTGLIYS
jgi:hypothetical protein